MSIIDKGIDKLIGLEHVNVSYEQLGGMVQEHFIKGAEDKFLKTVQRTAKGGSFSGGIRTLDTGDNRFRLTVNPGAGSFMVWILGKSVSVVDRVEKKDYTIPGRDWKKFYKLVTRLVEDEKMSRGK